MASDPAEAQRLAAEAQRLAEEERLVAQAQAGRMDALRPLFERYADPLYAGVILPRLGSAAAAEDVLKDTFLTAIEKIGSFRWEGRGIYGWLRQIAVNKTFDLHRRAQRQGRMAASLLQESPSATGPADAADEALIAAEERRANAGRIAGAMAAIPARYREAIELRLVQELPRDECARRMAVNLGNFDVLLFRAVRAFRVRFGERG